MFALHCVACIFLGIGSYDHEYLFAFCPSSHFFMVAYPVGIQAIFCKSCWVGLGADRQYAHPFLVDRIGYHGGRRR